MSCFAFILGAGASKHVRAPLMKDFLDVARQRFVPNEASVYTDDLNRVFSAMSKLQKVHSKSQLDLVNVESVFSAFEMADLLEIDPWDRNLLQSMRRLITWTLDKAISFRITTAKIIASHGDAYRNFAELLKTLHKKGYVSTVITFNYDVALDVELYGAGLNPTYGLSDDSAPVNLLKLHGSVNWRVCPKCQNIVSALFPRLGPHYHESAELSWSEVCKQLSIKTHCCGTEFEGDSFIVPPSWDKAKYRL